MPKIPHDRALDLGVEAAESPSPAFDVLVDPVLRLLLRRLLLAVLGHGASVTDLDTV